MATLATRLGRLEASRPTACGRCYSVIGGILGSDAEQFVRDQGFSLTDADMVLQIVPMAPSPSGPVHVDETPRWLRMPPAEWKAAA